MVPSFIEDTAAAADGAFQHESHAPFFTYDPLGALEETQTAISTTTPIVSSSDSVVGKPLEWSTWSTSHNSHHPSATSTPSQPLSSPIATSEPTSSISESSESASPLDENSVGKGPKVGVIAGITVVAFLLLLVIMLCAIDCRKRYNKKRAVGRDSELNVLEAEMRNGRAKQMNDSKTGLWHGLQYSRSDHESSSEGRAINASRFSKGSRREAVLWERVGEMRSQETMMGDSLRKESTIGSTSTANSKDGHKREFRWLPAHIPGERASLVSSAGSMNFPVSTKPAAPKSFLDGGLRW